MCSACNTRSFYTLPEILRHSEQWLFYKLFFSCACLPWHVPLSLILKSPSLLYKTSGLVSVYDHDRHSLSASGKSFIYTEWQTRRFRDLSIISCTTKHTQLLEKFPWLNVGLGDLCDNEIMDRIVGLADLKWNLLVEREYQELDHSWIQILFSGERGTFIWGEHSQELSNTWDHTYATSQTLSLLHKQCRHVKATAWEASKVGKITAVCVPLLL